MAELTIEEIVAEATAPRYVKETRDAKWHAFNGHIMEGIEVRFFEGGKYTPWRTEGFSSYHSDDCKCDDWDGGAGWDW